MASSCCLIRFDNSKGSVAPRELQIVLTTILHQLVIDEFTTDVRIDPTEHNGARGFQFGRDTTH